MREPRDIQRIVGVISRSFIKDPKASWRIGCGSLDEALAFREELLKVLTEEQRGRVSYAVNAPTGSDAVTEKSPGAS